MEEIGGIPAFVRRAGDARILYLHGVPTSSDDWLPFLERTGGVAPDLPGFGRSGKPGHRRYDLEEYGDWLEELVRDWPSVAIAGHDWGAAFGLVLAQRIPERVSRIVLADAVPLFAGHSWLRVARAWRRPLAGELAMGLTTRLGFTRSAGRARAVRTRLREEWPHFDQGTQRAVLRLYRSSARDEALAAAGARLDEIRAPALVVWGEDDPWIPAAWADRYAGALGGRTAVERVAGAGHWPWLEQPAVVERVCAFLRADGVEQGVAHDG